MNSLINDAQQNRLLYRELFFKASECFKKQINDLKSPSYCNKCRICCQIRYTEMSPQEIVDMKETGENISSGYINLFLPYGAGEDFSYKSNNNIDIEENNKLAREVNEAYVDLILSKSSTPMYFYYCKHLQDGKKCSLHQNENFVCTSFPSFITTFLPESCGYREWQKLALETIDNVIFKDIYTKLNDIEAFRQNFECKMCGTCCKLASSEFSYEELKEKAKNGDKFAKDFTSVFIPYENNDDAYKIFPEFVEMVKMKLKDSENIYFYHCPHITEDNMCSRYEDRPNVCREFPNNPLSILPLCCGFNDWKEDVQVGAMFLHALIEICEFHKNKIKIALEE